MRHHDPFENRRREHVIAVDWRDCVWQPQIIVRRPAAKPPFTPMSNLIFQRRNFICPKTMKTILPQSRRHRAGFTLIELLVVIAIIAILAALLLPVLASAVRAAKVKKATTEMQGIITAVEGYDSAYGRFPVSTNAQMAASAQNGDFTYGGTFNGGTVQNPAVYTYQANNAEVVAILMDMQTYPGSGAQTADYNHVKNPQQTVFLQAHMSGDTNSPGVGTDLVYRDPWGNPYVISMDLNYDEMCKDAFYCLNKVSSSDGTKTGPGLNGLINPDTTKDDNFQFRGKVMVWSAGPDGKIDSGTQANQGVNKDNVLSWQ